MKRLKKLGLMIAIKRMLSVTVLTVSVLAFSVLTVTVLAFSASTVVAQQRQTSPQDIGDKTWLWSQLKGQKTIDRMKAVQQKDLKQFETLLIATLSELEKPNEEIELQKLQDRWAANNWQLLNSPSGKQFVIREHPDHLHGRGAYAFQPKKKSRIVIQAPHRFNDLMTGSIAIKLFRAQAISAIALNTIDRSEVDLAHTQLHFINAFTSAMIKVQPDVAILQIHGFTNKGKTGAAKLAKIIVSDCTKFPGRSARGSALELKTTFGADHTRLFPVDIDQLGGTTNRQAKVAHDHGCPNFLHLELNREFREQLDADASVRASFFASLVRGVSQ